MFALIDVIRVALFAKLFRKGFALFALFVFLSLCCVREGSYEGFVSFVLFVF